jgi:hypothetical protein
LAFFNLSEPDLLTQVVCRDEIIDAVTECVESINLPNN